MKQIKNFILALLGALMCLCLSSCPTIQGETGPVGCLVRMDTDYSNNVMAIKYGEGYDYNNIVCENHTIYLADGYYYLCHSDYRYVAYTIWKSSECSDSLKSLNNYNDFILSKEPFKEAYYLYESCSDKYKKSLIKRIRENNFKGLERIL